MPETGNIKTFESPVDRLTPTNVGAEAYDMMGRHVEATYHQAGQEIGAAIGNAGRQWEEHDTTVQTADLMKNMSDLEIQAHQSMLNAKTTMDPNDPEAASKFMAGFQDQLDAITSKTYTPRAYDAMAHMTSDFNTRTRQNFTGYQSEAQGNQALANFNQATTSWGNLANQDPNYAKVGVDAVKLAGQSLPAEHRAEYTLQNTQHIMDSTGEGIVSRVEGMKVYDPNAVAAAKAYVNDPKNGMVDGMSSPKFAEINNRLDNARRSGANQTIAGMELNSEPMLKSVGLTGQVPDDLAAMVGNLKTVNTPESNAAAAKLEQGILDQRGTYGARQLITQLPSDKLASAQDLLTNETRRSDLTGAQIAVVQASSKQFDDLLKERQTAFSGADPAKQSQWEIDNNPGVRQAYDAWRANPNADTFLSYYQKSYADQRFLEPGSLPSVVTADIENDAKKIMNEITNDPKAGPLQANQDLQSMAKMYGQAWPQVAGDLAKKKIFNGDQLVYAGLYNNPGAQVWAEIGLKASAMTSKQREELHGISDAKAQALIRPQIDQLVGSMGNINNAGELTDMYINAASKIVQTTGMQDAGQLVKTMFLDNYQFVGAGSTIRLSAGVPDGPAIGDGSRAVLRDIGNHDLVVPSSTRLGSVNAKEAWADAVKANGVWYTSRDGKTATLYDGTATGNPVMEKNKQGRIVPVSLAFEELARLGKGKSIVETTIENEESHIK